MESLGKVLGGNAAYVPLGSMFYCHSPLPALLSFLWGMKRSELGH